MDIHINVTGPVSIYVPGSVMEDYSLFDEEGSLGEEDDKQPEQGRQWRA